MDSFVIRSSLLKEERCFVGSLNFYFVMSADEGNSFEIGASHSQVLEQALVRQRNLFLDELDSRFSNLLPRVIRQCPLFSLQVKVTNFSFSLILVELKVSTR